MAIKTSTFGRVELIGQDAAKFVQQISQTKSNFLALATLARGREIAEKINNGEKFELKLKNIS